MSSQTGAETEAKYKEQMEQLTKLVESSKTQKANRLINDFPYDTVPTKERDALTLQIETLQNSLGSAARSINFSHMQTLLRMARSPKTNGSGEDKKFSFEHATTIDIPSKRPDISLFAKRSGRSIPTTTAPISIPRQTRSQSSDE